MPPLNCLLVVRQCRRRSDSTGGWRIQSLLALQTTNSTNQICQILLALPRAAHCPPLRRACDSGGALTVPRSVLQRPQEGGTGGRAAKQQKTAGGTGPMPRARMQQLAQVLGELEVCPWSFRG